MFDLLQTIFFLIVSLLYPDLFTEPALSPTPTPLPVEILSATSSAHQVVTVVDGDTFKVASGDAVLTVRIIGINTPETKDPRKGVECYGQAASEYLAKRLDEKSVVLIRDPSQTTIDRYGRLLRYVEDSLGVDIGEELIRNGYAHEYTYNTPYIRQQRYQSAQILAQNENQGLWSTETCP